MNKLSILATLPDHGIKTNADKGIRIMFDTQEPTGEQFQEIFNMKGRFGKLIFASEETKITEKDLEIPEVKYEDSKSPSQRQRGIIFKAWERHGGNQPFELFYKVVMDTIAEQLKEKYLN